VTDAECGDEAVLQEVKQRQYIQCFLDFVSTYLISEAVTLAEFELVEKNLEILCERIGDVKSSVFVGLEKIKKDKE